MGLCFDQLCRASKLEYQNAKSAVYETDKRLQQEGRNAGMQHRDYVRLSQLCPRPPAPKDYASRSCRDRSPPLYDQRFGRIGRCSGILEELKFKRTHYQLATGAMLSLPR